MSKILLTHNTIYNTIGAKTYILKRIIHGNFVTNSNPKPWASINLLIQYWISLYTSKGACLVAQMKHLMQLHQRVTVSLFGIQWLSCVFKYMAFILFACSCLCCWSLSALLKPISLTAVVMHCSPVVFCTSKQMNN